MKRFEKIKCLFNDIFVIYIDQMKKWKAWELETSSLEYQFSNGNSFFSFISYTNRKTSTNSFLKKLVKDLGPTNSRINSHQFI